MHLGNRFFHSVRPKLARHEGRFTLRTFGWTVLGIAVYSICARIGLLLATVNQSVSPVWPATGFAIAFLSYRGLGSWPIVFLGALLGNVWSGSSVLVATGISVGNTLEAVVAILILNRLRSHLSTFDYGEEEFVGARHLASQFTMAVVSAAVSAGLGVLVLVASGNLALAKSGMVLLTWWVGDALGALVFAPIFYSLLHSRSFLQQLNSKRAPLALIVATTLVTTWIIFFNAGGGAFLFLLFPSLLLAGYLCHELGIRLITATIVTVATLATAHRFGPFAEFDINTGLVSMQLFIFALGLSAESVAVFRRVGLSLQSSAIMLAGWLFTGLSFAAFFNYDQKNERAHFQDIISASAKMIQNRIATYEDVLRSGAGLYNGHSQVTSKDWARFVSSLDVQSRYPGINGIGFIRYLRKDRDSLQAYENRRRESFPDFKIHMVPNVPLENQVASHGELAVIEHVEPLGWNRPALGLDVASEALRWNAARMSAETASATISGTIALIQDKYSRPGFLFFHPVYKVDGPKNANLKSLDSVLGWVYAPFVFENLMQGIRPMVSNELEFALIEPSDSGKSRTLFQTDAFTVNHRGSSEAIEASTLVIGSRKFSILWKRSRVFAGSEGFSTAWVASIGAILVLAIAWLFFNSEVYKRRAQSEVEAKTRELKERESLWRVLMSAAPVGIIQLDVDGNVNYTNPAWKAMAGSSWGMHAPRSLHEYAVEDDRKTVKDCWQRAGEEEKSIQVDFRMRRFDTLAEANDTKAPFRWLHLILDKIRDSEGQLIGFVGIGVDITEKIENANEVEKERMRSMNASRLAALGEMAGGIAHEINNPLAIIIGRASHMRELLERPDLSTEERTKIVKFAERIESTSHRISQIVKGLRLFSRESERDPFLPANLRAIVEETLSLCVERFKNHGVELEIGTIEDVEIECRSGQVSQVLLNLFNNAHDAVFNQPEKWVRVESKLVVSRKGSEFVEISVTDSGHGIPPEIADKIMQPFFTTKEVGKGTGLGLSVSKGIIDEHKGTLELDSTSARTRFIVRLPITRGAQMAQPA